MFCKKCGTQLADGASFCPECGTPVNALPTSEITSPEAPAEPEAPKKKKKANKKVIGGIVGGICAVVLVAVIVIGASWRNIAHAAMGEVDYYLWREGATLMDMFSTDALDDIMTAQDFSSDTKAKMYFPVEDMTISGDVAMSHQNNGNQTVAVATPAMEYDGESIKIGTYELNCKDGVLGISAEEITDAQIVIDFVNGVMGGFSSGSGSISASDFSDIDVKQTAKTLGTIIKNAEDETLGDCITKGRQELDGKKYSTVELTVDGKTAVEFLRAVVDGIMADPEAEELFTEYLQMGIDAYTQFTYDDEISSADELIDLMLNGLDNAAENAADDELIYTIFYGSKDSIVNRRVEIPAEDFSMDIKTVTEKNKTSLSIECDYFNAKLEKAEKDNSVTYRFDLSGEELSVQIEAEDLRVEKCSGVNVVLGDIEAYIAGISFNLNASLNGDSYDISSDAAEFDEDLFDISLSTLLSTEPDMSSFKQPDISNGVSFEEFAERFEEDFEEYIYNSIY